MSSFVKGVIYISYAVFFQSWFHAIWGGLALAKLIDIVAWLIKNVTISINW
jgi:hypothetical protein